MVLILCERLILIFLVLPARTRMAGMQRIEVRRFRGAELGDDVSVMM